MPVRGAELQVQANGEVPPDGKMQAMLTRDVSQEKAGELNKLLMAAEESEMVTPRVATLQQFSGTL